MKQVMCRSSYFEGESTHWNGKFLYISIKSKRLHSCLFIHLTNIYWVPTLCIALYETLAICHSFFFHEHLVKLSLNWLIHAFIILGKISLALCDRKLEMTRVQTIASCKYRSSRPQIVTPLSWKSISYFTLLLCCSYFFRLFHTLKFSKVLNI